MKQKENRKKTVEMVNLLDVHNLEKHEKVLSEDKEKALVDMVDFFKMNHGKNFENVLTKHLMRALNLDEEYNLDEKIFAIYLKGAIAKHIYLKNVVNNEPAESFDDAYYILKYKKTEVLLYSVLINNHNAYSDLIESDPKLMENALRAYVANGLLKDFDYKERYIPLDAIANAEQIEYAYDLKIKKIIKEAHQLMKIDQPILELKYN